MEPLLWQSGKPVAAGIRAAGIEAFAPLPRRRRYNYAFYLPVHNYEFALELGFCLPIQHLDPVLEGVRVGAGHADGGHEAVVLRVNVAC